MDGPRNYPTKWNKSEREIQISYDITYMWNLKNNDRKELIYKTETDSHRKQTMVTKRERCGEWGGMG